MFYPDKTGYILDRVTIVGFTPRTFDNRTTRLKIMPDGSVHTLINELLLVRKRIVPAEQASEILGLRSPHASPSEKGR